MKKTIFITGASSGLGKATAILFQEKGWNVIATMRNPEKETELNKLENVTILPLDVTHLEQVKETIEKAISLYEIDVVFNNAGYGIVGPLEALTDEQIIKNIHTNLLGVIRVTKAFIPYFRQKKSGLFLNTTSIGGIIGFPLNSIYHATKWAVEGWAESMWFELQPFNIGIKTIAPGGIKTDFAGRSLDTNSHTDYQELEKKLLNSFDEAMKAAATAREIAQVVYEAATNGKDQVRYVTGNDAKAMYKRRLEIGNEDFRKEVKEQFLGA